MSHPPVIGKCEVCGFPFMEDKEKLANEDAEFIARLKKEGLCVPEECAPLKETMAKLAEVEADKDALKEQLDSDTGIISRQRDRVVRLQDRITRLEEALREARAFIKRVFEYRGDDGEILFGVIDYYGMEDQMKKIDALLAIPVRT